MSSAARWQTIGDDAARRQGGRRGALLLAGAGAGLGTRTAVSGRLVVVGLGPGRPAEQLTPEARAALAAGDATSSATGRISTALAARRRPDGACVRQSRGTGRGRRRRWRLAAAGRSASRVVSGGDPGRLRHGGGGLRGDRAAGRREWRRHRRSRSSPGSRRCWRWRRACGAPLGHDFCALSLSDNLKPWELIEARLRAAAAAGFVHRALQPDHRGRGRGSSARPSRVLREHLAGGDAGDLRPRGRPAGRTHRGGALADGRSRAAPTWRPASSSARRRRGSSRGRALPPLVYTPRAAGGAAGDRASDALPRRARRRAHRPAAAGATMTTWRPSARAAAILP